MKFDFTQKDKDSNTMSIRFKDAQCKTIHILAKHYKISYEAVVRKLVDEAYQEARSFCKF